MIVASNIAHVRQISIDAISVAWRAIRANGPFEVIELGSDMSGNQDQKTTKVEGNSKEAVRPIEDPDFLNDTFAQIKSQDRPVSRLQRILLEAAVADKLSEKEIVRLTRRINAHPDLASLFALVSKRLNGLDAGADGFSTKDLLAVIRLADLPALKLIRALQFKNEDARFPGAVGVLLQHFGFNQTDTTNLTTAIQKNNDRGTLADFARIGAQSSVAEDLCITSADNSWRKADRFENAYASAQKISAWGRDVSLRMQTIANLAVVASHKPGDFVECGVDTGGSAVVAMTYLGDAAFANRNFYLFDTFEGLDHSQKNDDELVKSVIPDSRYPNVLDQVRETFADRDYVRIVPGRVPDTLGEFQGNEVAYLHIDMNLALPEVAALQFFWPKLAMGAPVIFDDYAFPTHAPQREALDAVAQEFGTEIMSLPTGQGLLFKV